MYRLHTCGPDNDSTYAACFGRSSRSGPVVAESRALVGLLDAVLALGHDNFAVWRGKERVAATRREYLARPVVAQALACRGGT